MSSACWWKVDECWIARLRSPSLIVDWASSTTDSKYWRRCSSTFGRATTGVSKFSFTYVLTLSQIISIGLSWGEYGANLKSDAEDSENSSSNPRWHGALSQTTTNSDSWFPISSHFVKTDWTHSFFSYVQMFSVIFNFI